MLMDVVDGILFMFVKMGSIIVMVGSDVGQVSQLVFNFVKVYNVLCIQFNVLIKFDIVNVVNNGVLVGDVSIKVMINQLIDVLG